MLDYPSEFIEEAETGLIATRSSTAVELVVGQTAVHGERSMTLLVREFQGFVCERLLAHGDFDVGVCAANSLRFVNFGFGPHFYLCR